MIPVGFVVGIAELVLSDAGLKTQREINHPGGIAGIEGPRDEGLVSRENSRINADTKRQRKDRHGGEPGVSEQSSRRVTQVLEYGSEQDHRIDLSIIAAILRKHDEPGENGCMRKRIVESERSQTGSESQQDWLNVEQIATVEATSEDPNFPVESVFASDGGSGWRASQKGAQRIRLLFDEPVALHRIQLRFHEPEFERTQEFTLRWSSSVDGPATEIVRQQWTFSPSGSTTEVEEYAVNVESASVLELVIQPDISRREAVASLASWRLR